MSELVSTAIRRFKGYGHLLNHLEIKKLGDAMAAVNATADLLGRTRIREQSDRARVFKGSDSSQDFPFASFADELPGVMATPEDAVAYFLSLRPELGIDPKRYATSQRRQAFTLAASANQTLTERVQKIIADSLRGNRAVADSSASIARALSEAGVSRQNPQYSEMVFRTNAMDSYQTGLYEEGTHADVAEDFPVWQYLGIKDGRQGKDHEPHFDKFYPSHASFAEVRGNRPYNCRCSLKWVDQYDWQRIKSGGGVIEEKW